MCKLMDFLPQIRTQLFPIRKLPLWGENIGICVLALNSQTESTIVSVSVISSLLCVLGLVLLPACLLSPCCRQPVFPRLLDLSCFWIFIDANLRFEDEQRRHSLMKTFRWTTGEYWQQLKGVLHTTTSSYGCVVAGSGEWLLVPQVLAQVSLLHVSVSSLCSCTFCQSCLFASCFTLTVSRPVSVHSVWLPPRLVVFDLSQLCSPCSSTCFWFTLVPSSLFSFRSPSRFSFLCL